MISIDEHSQYLLGVTGAVVSLYDIGCFLGALSIGLLCDRFGRERSISLIMVVFIIGAVIQTASYVRSQIVHLTRTLLTARGGRANHHSRTDHTWRRRGILLRRCPSVHR